MFWGNALCDVIQQHKLIIAPKNRYGEYPQRKFSKIIKNTINVFQKKVVADVYDLHYFMNKFVDFHGIYSH